MGAFDWLEDAWEDTKDAFADAGEWVEGAAKDAAGFLGANVADSLPVVGQLNALVGVIDSFTNGDNFLNEGDPNRIPPELKSIVLPPKPVEPRPNTRTNTPESRRENIARIIRYRQDLVVYETLVEAKKNVDALLQDMRSKVVQYRDKGYVDNDDQNAFEAFGSALTGRISRGALPLKAALSLAREHILGGRGWSSSKRGSTTTTSRSSTRYVASLRRNWPRIKKPFEPSPAARPSRRLCWERTSTTQIS
jgi:hypothetical protein